jgi:hypothetical protein
MTEIHPSYKDYPLVKFKTRESSTSCGNSYIGRLIGTHDEYVHILLEDRNLFRYVPWSFIEYVEFVKEKPEEKERIVRV